jgi:ubiquinone biosynthesis protein COQ9
MALIDSDKNKEKILKKFLEIIENEDCSEESLKKSLIQCDFDPKLQEIFFENGILDLINFAIDLLNEENFQKFHQKNRDNLGISDKIIEIFKIRLELISKYQKPFVKIISFLRNDPKNLTFIIKKSYQFADLIWYEIGDKSTDFNFYSKRIIFSKIYLKTLNYFLKSNSIPKTLLYFEKQISYIVKFSKVKYQIKDVINNISCQSDKNRVEYSKGFFRKTICKLPFFRLYNDK